MKYVMFTLLFYEDHAFINKKIDRYNNLKKESLQKK